MKTGHAESSIRQVWNVLKHYWPVLVCFYLCMLADDCIVNLTNSFILPFIEDINRPLFGIGVIAVSILTAVLIVRRYRERHVFFTHGYLCVWVCAAVIYIWYRWICGDYVFWGFDLSGIHIAYLDFLFLPLFCLVLCKSGRKNIRLHSTGMVQDDIPIADFEDDILGYGDMTGYLLSDIEQLGTDSNHSFSVGITGHWGIGKSSFLNLLEKRITKGDNRDQNIVVRFYPRSASRVDTIQDDFFETFSKALNGYYFGFRKLTARYVRSLKLADGDNWLRWLVGAFETLNAERDKSRIDDIIRNIGRRIFVIVEDMDRLSGPEILEVFKLMDRNADFSNVVFISAYDKGYVNCVLSKNLGHANDRNFTDKYFTYEISLPNPQPGHIIHYVNHYLDSYYGYGGHHEEQRAEIKTAWESSSGIAVPLLGSLRHAKRFLNLFMSRYPIIRDDVNAEDFLLLTLIRYLNLNVYNSISRFDLVRRGGFAGSHDIMYLVGDYNDRLAAMGASDLSVLIEKLFPLPSQAGYNGDGVGSYRRVNSAQSFDIYFHDRSKDRIYHQALEGLFEQSDDAVALEKLESMFDPKFRNTGIIGLFLDEVFPIGLNSGNLKRYMKLTIQYEYMSSRKAGLAPPKVGVNMLLRKETMENILRSGIAESMDWYRSSVSSVLEDMVHSCSFFIGRSLINILDGFRDKVLSPDIYIFESTDYESLTMKCLKSYGGHCDGAWNPWSHMRLSLIYLPGSGSVLPEAREYMMNQINESPLSYIRGKLHHQVYTEARTNQRMLLLHISGHEMMKEILGSYSNLRHFFDEKLQDSPMREVLTAVCDAYIEGKDGLTVPSLEENYTPEDYDGFKTAIDSSSPKKTSLEEAFSIQV